MKKIEILQNITNIHNHLSGVMVCGDSAIIMGDVIKRLRVLVADLQQDINNECSEKIE